MYVVKIFTALSKAWQQYNNHIQNLYIEHNIRLRVHEQYLEEPDSSGKLGPISGFLTTHKISRKGKNKNVSKIRVTQALLTLGKQSREIRSLHSAELRSKEMSQLFLSLK